MTWICFKDVRRTYDLIFRILIDLNWPEVAARMYDPVPRSFLSLFLFEQSVPVSEELQSKFVIGYLEKWDDLFPEIIGWWVAISGVELCRVSPSGLRQRRQRTDRDVDLSRVSHGGFEMSRFNRETKLFHAKMCFRCGSFPQFSISVFCWVKQIEIRIITSIINDYKITVSQSQYSIRLRNHI